MPDPKNNSAQQGVQVISRAVAILRTLRERKASLSLGQISEAVCLPRSTVQRIVNALIAENLLTRASPRGGYRIGPEIQLLAAAGRVDVANLVRPHLTALSRETGETVDLAEFRHDHMVFIDQNVGTHRLRAVATVGEEFPLFCTANGKACLSLQDDQAIDRLFKGELRDSQQGNRLLSEFFVEIEQIRQQGYAFDLGEHTEGISAVGAAFVDLDQRVYAISIPVPTPRFEQSRDQLTECLLRTLKVVNGIFAV